MENKNNDNGKLLGKVKAILITMTVKELIVYIFNLLIGG